MIKKSIVVFGFMFFVLLVKSQTTEDSLKNVIDRFFDCMQKNDTVSMKQISSKDCYLKSIILVDGKIEFDLLPLSSFLKIISQPLDQSWEEKIINYTYLKDDLMATVWSEYQFIYDGKLSHTGVNQFTLVLDKENGKAWKIISIIDTRYVDGIGDVSKTENEKSESAIISGLVDDWHKNAANAKLEPFFELMSDSCIYKGTDKTERWGKTEFYGFSKPYFDKGKAWDFKPSERKIKFDDNLQTAWFDEKLDTWMGVCKGTGVLRKENGIWKLLLYDLSVTIDNDKIDSFIKLTDEKQKKKKETSIRIPLR